MRLYLIVGESSVDEIKATSAITLSDRGRRAAGAPPLSLCSRHKCNSVRLCEIDCVPFCPRKRPTNNSVRRISYFVVAHNAIIQTHEEPVALTGSKMELVGRAGHFASALCKFAPISIPDAKLDGNRRICFLDLVTPGYSDFTRSSDRQTDSRQCPVRRPSLRRNSFSRNRILCRRI